MAESANIVKACVQQWRNSASLRSIDIRSTRVQQGEVKGSTFPYALLENRVLSRKFSSAAYRLTYYLVTFTVFVGQSKATVSSIDDAIAALFDRNIGLPVLDNCYVLSVQSVEDDPELDPKDYYGSDVNTLRQTFKILLNETITPIQQVTV